MYTDSTTVYVCSAVILLLIAVILGLVYMIIKMVIDYKKFKIANKSKTITANNQPAKTKTKTNIPTTINNICSVDYLENTDKKDHD